MGELVDYHSADGIATIVLQNGKANAISHQLIDQLHLCLDRAEQEQAVVMLTGRSTIFSAGYDLSIIQQGRDSANALVRQGSLLSKRLLSFPQPVIVACNGHAMAKGAFLLLSADYRIGISGPYKIGLNEIRLGMTMHHAGLTIATYRLAPNYFQRSVLCAEIFTADEAVKAGFLDQVVAEQQLSDVARGVAKELVGLNKKAHYATKLKARAALLDRLSKDVEKDFSSALLEA